MKKPIRVLSIDGGGTRGLFPATFLHELEKETGKPITELFDVIVGAATGGIITVALSGGMTIAEIKDIYLNRAKELLPYKFFRKFPIIGFFTGLFLPKYPSNNLKRILEEKIGATTTLEDTRAQFGNDTIFISAALNMSPNITSEAIPSFAIEVYNSVYSNYEKDKLVDLALRTSAAPIFLPLHQARSEGGSFANDPSMLALSFCMNTQQATKPDTTYLENNQLGLGLSPADIRLLSIGCGTDGRTYVPGKKVGTGKWGLIKWAGQIINLIIETSMSSAQYFVKQYLNENQYLRINPYYKAADAPEVLQKTKVKLDVRKPKQLEALKAYAEQTFDREKERIIEFLEL